MKKRMISIFLVLLLGVMIIVPAGAAEVEVLYEEHNMILHGFSYSTDGKNIDSSYLFEIKVDIEVLEEKAYLSVISGPEELDCTQLTLIELEKCIEGLYYQDVGGGISVYLEYVGETALIDIIVGDRAYAFGGDRLEKVRNYITSTTQHMNAGDNINGTVEQAEVNATATGLVKSKSTSSMRYAAYWNPTRSNRLYLLVNTVGTRYGEWVSGVKITGGSVPSSYVIVGANPTGSNSSGANDVLSVIDFLINSTTSFAVYMPSVSGTQMSTINGNKFTFNLQLYYPWNSLNYTGSSTVNQSNGIAMYLFLDHNGVKPIPTGTLILTTHVAATGTFTQSMAL